MPEPRASSPPPLTFLMTDLEGSTALWEAYPDRAGAVVERHEEIVSAVVTDNGGELVKTRGEGDSTVSVFEVADRALATAVAVERALFAEPWPPGCEIRVRAALYSGVAQRREGDYYGIPLNRCARLRSMAQGGQILCADSTVSLVGRPPGDVTLRDVGLHRLRDVSRAERVFQVVAPGLPDGFPALGSPGVRHNLPAERTSFVGREAELAELSKLLDTERVTTVTGAGGTGKTRLAVAAARAALDLFPDGVFFAGLATVADGAMVPRAIAAAVGSETLAVGSASGRTRTELIEFLTPRRLLLVLDNCEHVVEAAAELVDSIADQCEDVVVLVTSRQPLEVAGERVVHLTPLPVDASLGQDHSDAVALFRSRLPDRIGPTPVDDAVLAELCRRLDGMPLAIELAAARCVDLDPSEILEQIDRRLEVLGTSRPGRHQSLAATLDWSHDLLTEDERVAFRRLSVFPGAFTAEEATSVCGPPLGPELLWSLARHSLVESMHDPDHRYRLMETVRVYAATRLRDAGEDQDVGGRHRDHYLGWLEAIPEDLTFLDPSGSIRSELDNLLAALRWSDEHDEPDLVARLAAGMNAVWVGDPSLGKRWLARGREGLEQLDEDSRVRLLTVSAHVAILSIEAADGALATAAVDVSDERPGLWSSLAHAFLAFNRYGRYFQTKDRAEKDEADRLGELAISLAATPLARQLVQSWIGQGLALADDLPAAIAALERAAVPAVPGGDLSAVALAMLAMSHHVRGDHDAAYEAASQVRERADLYPVGGLWAWGLYLALPYILELGASGAHAEAVHEMRLRLDEVGQMRTPGVMTSLLNVLAALASMRDDEEVAGLLLAHVGVLVFRDGIRTPLDLVLYSHYFQRESARSNRSPVDDDRAASLTAEEALAIGLGDARP